jgi:hypothetical protein
MSKFSTSTLALALTAALAGPAAWAETIYTNGPSGAHYANGSAEPVCTVNASQDVSCTGTTIAGVGNTNAVATLSVTYSGTVQCRNHGGQIVDVKTQTTESTSTPKLRPTRNGELVVSPLTVTAPTAAELVADATCPNGNWTKELLGGPTLTSYVYTLVFAGYTQPFISIVGP